MAKKKAPKPRTVVVVAGMHRSGTSALSRALSFHGFAQPADPMPPQVDNPKGFFEPLGVVRLNNRIHKAFGGAWDKPGPYILLQHDLKDSRAAIAQAVEGRWLADAAAAVAASAGEAQAAVLKDPRICPFLPLWDKAIVQAGFQPRYVLIHRNPLEVAASLKARNAIPPRRALQLWLLHNLDALELELEGKLDAVVAYEDLLANPKGFMAALAKRLDAPVKMLGAQDAAALAGYISAGDRHHVLDDEAALSGPQSTEMVKRTWALLRNWDATPAEERAQAIRRLHASFDDAMLLAGPIIAARLDMVGVAPEPRPAPPPKAEAAKPAPVKAAPGTGRTLIVHYHLFKNAGTSVDDMLKRNFAERWGDREFKTPGHRTNTQDVAAYLGAQPELDAFSSHTALLPLPALEGVRVFPIIFVRHPVDRLKSAYGFERTQAADTFGARLAKETDFAGYLRELLHQPTHRQARNFQTFRLAFNEPADAGTERARALRALESLPFVGLVEAYDRSVEALEAALKPYFPDFRGVAVRKNVTRPLEDLSQKLAKIEDEIGSELFAAVCAANAEDIEIYETVRRRYDAG